MWVKKKDRSMDTNVIKYKKFTDILAEFWCSIKKEHPQLSEKALTLSFIKQLSAWGGAVFRGMNRTTQHNRDSSGSRRV